jgi:hypothetical protein
MDLFNENKIGFTYWTWRTASDSTEHGLYWQSASDKQFYLKQELYNVLNEKLGGVNRCIQTSMTQKYSTFHLKMYPNPAYHEIMVMTSSQEPFQAKIINSFGQLALTSENQNRLNISSLPSGVYILNVRQGQHYFVTKFFKF